MRNFWNKVWTSFVDEIEKQNFIRNSIEFIITIVIFTVINTAVFDGKDITYVSMLAGCALFVAISTRRRLDNQ
jgi:hypothetical protein